MNDWEFDLVFGLSEEARSRLGNMSWGPFTLSTSMGLQEVMDMGVPYVEVGINNVQVTNNLQVSGSVISGWL